MHVRMVLMNVDIMGTRMCKVWHVLALQGVPSDHPRVLGRHRTATLLFWHIVELYVFEMS